jgi:hypothetical protein
MLSFSMFSALLTAPWCRVLEGHHRWWPLNKEAERFLRLRRSNEEYRYWLYAANPPPSKHGGPSIFSFPQMALISKCCFAECGCYFACRKGSFSPQARTFYLDIDAWMDAPSMCRQLYTLRVWSLNLSDGWECSFIEALLQGLWRACWKSVIMQCV